MRRLALATAALALTVATAADAPPNGPAEAPPGQRLYPYLEAEAKKHFDARRKAVAALKTPADVAGRQAALRAKFREALGELPAEKTPLNPRVVGRDRRDGYAVERVVYESRPGHHVTALFYVPEGKPPFPGVLVPCGHSANGKAAETYQQACILLAKNGLAVLCDDPIGQGERAQWLDDRGRPAVKESTTEHTLVGIGALLVGRSAAGYRFWDGVRGLDYLASRPEVDPARLGCTGNSGGGTMTAYLMALDDRVAAAAPSCYITSLERLIATIGPQDAEQDITGQIAFGLGHADYVTLRAPKPTLLSVGTRDYFDIRGSWDTFQEAKRVYGKLGFGERVDLFESDEPHGFTRPRREAVTRWMRRWLLGKDDAAAETPSPVAADKDVQCTETGQVLTAFHGRSAFDLNAERARELDRLRAERFAGRPVGALRAEVRKRLALPAPGPLIADGHKNWVIRDGIRIDHWTYTTEPGLTIPVVLFRPEPPAEGKSMTVYVGADRASPELMGSIEGRVQNGETVALIEPRGLGASRPGGADGRKPGLPGADEKEAFLALMLGRPLLGQRVYDVLQSLKGLVWADRPGQSYRLVGIGAGGPVALHVAALDERAAEVEIERSLISWSAVARGKLSRDQLANAVPGVLESYDLPDLAASIAPRALTVRQPLDPAGEPVSQAALDEAYAACKAAYRAASAGDRLVLKAAP